MSDVSGMSELSNLLLPSWKAFASLRERYLSLFNSQSTIYNYQYIYLRSFVVTFSSHNHTPEIILTFAVYFFSFAV